MVVRVVLEFEDESEAKNYVRDVIAYGWRVIGVFKRPTKYCTPGDGHRNTKRASGWTRGKKYGWWVCAVCGKPTEHWASGDLWPFSLGFNLLPASIAPWAQAEGGWSLGVARWKEEDLDVLPRVDSTD